MKIHLIGIGGTGMGALAGLLVEAGHEVRGSDGPLYPPMSTLLKELGVPLFEGFNPSNLDWNPDRVVVGNICRKDHPEAAAARERGLTLTSFPALLEELFLMSRHSIVVAGTHGKTTTTSLFVHVLSDAGLSPGFLVGGIPRNFGKSYALGEPPYFIVEGDEYDTAYFDKRPKFVHYRPQTVILTSVEFDHADIYPSLADVEHAFTMLLEKIPPDGRLLVCADSEVALRLSKAAPCPVETYSVDEEKGNPPADWQAQLLRASNGKQEIAVRHHGETIGKFLVPMTGRHNRANALAVIAAGHSLGLDAPTLSFGLGSFQGVRRRQEVRGQKRGVTVIDDFAHHPTAIRETLDGLRGIYGQGRVLAVFEPRSATSRRNVFQTDFVKALSVADEVVVAALHAPEGIPPEQRLDPRKVAEDIQHANVPAAYFEEVDQIVAHLASRCQTGDTVVVMSSGGFGGLIDRLLAAL